MRLIVLARESVIERATLRRPGVAVCATANVPAKRVQCRQRSDVFDNAQTAKSPVCKKLIAIGFLTNVTRSHCQRKNSEGVNQHDTAPYRFV